MKKLIAVAGALVLLLVMVGAAPAVAAPPQEITIPVMQQQTRYYPDDSLWFSLTAFQTSFELTLTGKVLHGEMSYSPSVTDLRGEKYVFVYDRKADKWKLSIGVIQYTSPHSGLTIKEQWEGYLKLDSDFNLIEGQLIQYAYVVGDPAPNYPWAQPVAGQGLWYLGYGVYTYTPVP